MAGRGRLKRICTNAFFVAGAVQEASSAEMFGAQGADFGRTSMDEPIEIEK